jgi:phage shock protein A
MALLERISTLLRANLNDLLDKAEDPEKLSKQIILDMENQLLQVKTQFAVSVANQHGLLKQQKDHEAEQSGWRRKAELAVDKGQDDLARAALERSLSHGRLAEGFAQQHADQAAEAETLRTAYSKLEGKLSETKARVALLLAQHRRNRAAAKANPAQPILSAAETAGHMTRLTSTVAAGDIAAHTNRAAHAIASSEDLDGRFKSLEQEDQIETLLLELKEQRGQKSLS